MAIYRCDECDNSFDDDWNVGQEWKEGVICESCADANSCEYCGVLSEDLVNGWHKHCRKEYSDEKRGEIQREERG